MPREKVKVVYLGAPLDEFGGERSPAERRAVRRGFGAGDDDLVVGTVTRLHDSKGNEYLVEAARNVIDRFPRALFVLAGEGPLRPRLEEQARALRLRDRFVFAGFVRDVAGLLSAFDISVFPSLWEGTPLTAFEALAAGKAIVSTDADGLLDVLTDGQDALIVPKRDASGLADRIVWLLERPEERARLSVAARESGREYDIGAFVRKMERLYTLLHEVSRKTKRKGILAADLSFLGPARREERSRL
ncbi:MAG: glycosyltransferase family 1 protein [Acidobacteria bacterium]|nr:MAG: glycosyltransferase family 1 protein [Acidobacteriota bacterium]